MKEKRAPIPKKSYILSPSELSSDEVPIIKKPKIDSSGQKKIDLDAKKSKLIEKFEKVNINK